MLPPENRPEALLAKGAMIHKLVSNPKLFTIFKALFWRE